MSESDRELGLSITVEAAMQAAEQVTTVYRGWVEGTDIGRYGTEELDAALEGDR